MQRIIAGVLFLILLFAGCSDGGDSTNEDESTIPDEEIDIDEPSDADAEPDAEPDVEPIPDHLTVSGSIDECDRELNVVDNAADTSEAIGASMAFIRPIGRGGETDFDLVFAGFELERVDGEGIVIPEGDPGAPEGSYYVALRLESPLSPIEAESVFPHNGEAGTNRVASISIWKGAEQINAPIPRVRIVAVDDTQVCGAITLADDAEIGVEGFFTVERR